jgi:hypothetical protein
LRGGGERRTRPSPGVHPHGQRASDLDGGGRFTGKDKAIDRSIAATRGGEDSTEQAPREPFLDEMA